MKIVQILLASGAIAFAGCGSTESHTAPQQQPAPPQQITPTIGMAPVTRVGVVVRDVEAASRAFADILAVPVPAVKTAAIQLPDNSTVEIKTVSIALPNVELELDQPVTNRGPLYDHLQDVGPGLQYIEFPVEDVDAIREGLEKKSGTWTAGARGGDYAFVNFRQTLGATIKVANTRAQGKGSNQPSTPPNPRALGTIPLGHVSIAVRDYDDAATALADILDVTPLPGQRVKIVLPPGHRWNRDTSVDVAMLRMPNTGLELVEAVAAPSPWAEWVEKKRGNAIHHIGFNVDTIDDVERSIRFLRDKGGTWTVGGPKNFYGYVDFADILGLTIEIVGNTRPPAAGMPSAER